MTTPRDFLDLVKPDHEPNFRVEVGQDFSAKSYTHVLDCSCGYSASYKSLAEFFDAWPEVGEERAYQWFKITMLNHLLDQELDKVSIVDLAGRVS